MNSSQLTELEDDIQQQLASAEERVRQEVNVAPAAPILFLFNQGIRIELRFSTYVCGLYKMLNVSNHKVKLSERMRFIS